MRPQLISLLELPDFVSLGNAALGFGSVVAVFAGRMDVAAQLILFGSIADGLDGLVAKHAETSDIGVELDSLADVISFGVAPAVFVYELSKGLGPVSLLPVIYILSALVRLAAYNVRDSDTPGFTGVPSTLAGTSIGAVYLADITKYVSEYVEPGVVYLALILIFAYLMLIQTEYPDLVDRDALGMGVVMALAAIVPGVFYSVFPRLIVAFLAVFLIFGPWKYWN